jgi:hypothetical protein
MEAVSTTSSAAECEETTTVEESAAHQENPLKLRLKKQKKDEKKIQWTEDTVDNEGEFEG